MTPSTSTESDAPEPGASVAGATPTTPAHRFTPEATPGTATAERTSRGMRAVQGVVLALIIGLPAGLLLAHFRLQVYRDSRDALVPLTATCLENGFFWALVGLAAWAIVYRVLREMSENASQAAVITSVAVGVFPASWYVYYANVFYLPGFFQLPSLLGNLVMLALLAVLLRVASRRLRSWADGTWRLGAVGWMFGILLAVVPAMAHIRGHAARRAENGEVDVLVLVLNSLRADHLGCYGKEPSVTPSLDRLARDSVLFERAFSSSTLAKSSVASLLTGLHPYQHGVYRGTFTENNYPEILSEVLGEEHRTLAEELHGEGFQTVAWVTNVQLHGYLGYGQGFGLYVNYAGWIRALREQFKTWCDEWADRQRFFAFLHFMDLHSPFVAADSDGDSVEDRVRTYDLRLTHTDRGLGRMFEDLRRSGRYDDTLIIVTGDSGMGFEERPFETLDEDDPDPPYEEFVHVPLLVKMPGAQYAGRRVSDPVGLVDVAPTILDALGLDPLEEAAGESLLPLLEGGRRATPDGKEKPVLVETRQAVALRTRRWKYIRSGNERRELYDLNVDPEERDECSERYPEFLVSFEREVRRILERRQSRRRAGREAVDREALGRLKGLGYL